MAVTSSGPHVLSPLRVKTDIYTYTLPVCQVRGNADVDTGTETVDSFADTTFHDSAGDGWGSCKWQYILRNGTNIRSGEVYAIWDTSENIDYYERSDSMLGTAGYTAIYFTVDIAAGNVRLLATAASDDWEVYVVRQGR